MQTTLNFEDHFRGSLRHKSILICLRDAIFGAKNCATMVLKLAFQLFYGANVKTS